MIKRENLSPEQTQVLESIGEILINKETIPEACFMTGGGGVGKEQPDSTMIPTPTRGWVTLGSIKINDYVFDRLGLPTRVIGVYPQGYKDIYEIILGDGRQTRAGREHLWQVHDLEGNKHILNTEEIMNRLESGLSLKLPRHNQVCYIKQHGQEVLPPFDCFLAILRGLRRRSRVHPDGTILYIPKDKKDKELMQEWLHSMGHSSRRYNDIDDTLEVLIPNSQKEFFFLETDPERKILEKNRTNPDVFDFDYVEIQEIRKGNYKEKSTCIYVENDEHLYLCDDFIVTHNTTITSVFLDDCIRAGFQPILTAPTHTVRERMLGLHPEIEPMTIHRFLGYTAISHEYGETKYGFSDKETEFTRFVPGENILIVDEATMLDDVFVEKIIEKTQGRVLFIGDLAQIPPIVSDDFDRTRILSEEESTPGVQRYVRNIFTLTRCFRQDEKSALFQVCNLLRESIFSGECIDYYFNIRSLLKKIDEIINDVGDKSVYTNIRTEKIVPFLTKRSKSVFLAYGNPTVNAVQKLLPEWYQVGGMAMTNGPLISVSKDTKGAIQTNLLMANNTHVKIQELNKNSGNVWGIPMDSVRINEHDVLVPNDLKLFETSLEALKRTAMINEKSRGKSSFDEEVTLCNWSLSKFLARTVILRDARVSTIHRAQGLQWEKSIVCVGNILFAGRNMNPDRDKQDIQRKIVAMKMLYTAFSRSEKLLILNNWFDKKKLSKV